MEEILVVEQLPSVAQYYRLREAVGWRLHTAEVIARALPNTLYSVCAFVDGELVGMARVIGDGGMAYYIQDVIVLPVYQQRGIGAQMMDRVMEYIRTHAGHNAVVGLMAACGKEPFYEKYGFTCRPNERLGAGMTIFWN